MKTGRPLLTLVPEEVVIPVDRLTFLVPSRRFQVEGTLLKGGYVSLATEFAMRLLRDVGELTHGELGVFLGFSDGETRNLVQELLLDGYLEASDDRVRLAGRGEGAFDPVTGELRLLDIETFSEKVTLDLISFAPVDGPDNVRLPWIPELAIPNREKAAAASKEGTRGFRANFGEWRDRRFRSDANSPIRLHTLTGDAVPLARLTVPITVPILYSPSQGDGVNPDFGFLRDRGRRDARKALIEALNDAVKRIVAPSDFAEGAAFAASWDGGVLTGPSRSPVINPLSWMQFASRPQSSPLPESLAPSVRLGGSVTSPGFLSQLSAFLEGVPGPDTEGVPVFWMPACHAAWGASEDLLEVSRTIKSSLSPEAGTVLMPRSDYGEKSKRDLTRAYGGGRDGQSPMFDTCIVLPDYFLPLSLEVLVQPGSWAVVLLHVPSGNGFPVPVGYATRNPDVVASIGRMISGVVSSLPDTAVVWAARNAVAASVLRDLVHALH